MQWFEWNRDENNMCPTSQHRLAQGSQMGSSGAKRQFKLNVDLAASLPIRSLLLADGRNPASVKLLDRAMVAVWEGQANRDACQTPRTLAADIDLNLCVSLSLCLALSADCIKGMVIYLTGMRIGY